MTYCTEKCTYPMHLLHIAQSYPQVWITLKKIFNIQSPHHYLIFLVILHFVDIISTLSVNNPIQLYIILCKPRGKLQSNIVMRFVLSLFPVDNCVEKVENQKNPVISLFYLFLSPPLYVEKICHLVYIISVWIIFSTYLFYAFYHRFYCSFP